MPEPHTILINVDLPDPLIQQIFAVYPNPNGTIVDGARGLLHFPSHSLVNSNNVTGRIDHDFSEQAILSVRYTFNQYSDSDYQHEDFLSGIGGVSTLQHNHNLTARLTSTAARGLINELHLAFNRLEFPLTCTGTNLFDVAQLQYDGNWNPEPGGWRRPVWR